MCTDVWLVIQGEGLGGNRCSKKCYDSTSAERNCPEKFFFPKLSGPQKGLAQRKTSKSIKNIFDIFRRFSRRAKNLKNRQEVSQIIFDTFRQFARGTNYPAPFEGL